MIQCLFRRLRIWLKMSPHDAWRKKEKNEWYEFILPLCRIAVIEKRVCYGWNRVNDEYFFGVWALWR